MNVEQASMFDPPPTTPTKRRVRADQLPDGWAPSPDKMMDIRAKFPSVDHEAELDNFIDHHLAKGSAFIDWAAAYRTWCRNCIKFGTYPPPAVAVKAEPEKPGGMTEEQRRFLVEQGLL